MSEGRRKARRAKVEADTPRRKGDAQQIIQWYLAEHPSSTIADIEAGTGLPYATIHSELRTYQVGEAAEPRYAAEEYGVTPNGRPALVWRLATEELAVARRRLKDGFKRIGRVLAKHPELTEEVVTWAMSVAADSTRRRKKKF